MHWLKRDTKLNDRLQRVSVARLRAEREAEQRAAVREAQRHLKEHARKWATT